jgi:hypothetical protein
MILATYKLAHTPLQSVSPGMSYPGISIKYMFDVLEPGSAPGSVCDDPASRIPLERSEAQICELTTATCRFLVLLGDFDARCGWASWEMNSYASWLSWKCQMSSGPPGNMSGEYTTF